MRLWACVRPCRTDARLREHEVLPRVHLVHGAREIGHVRVPGEGAEGATIRENIRGQEEVKLGDKCQDEREIVSKIESASAEI